jgi:hypothetical protein
VDFIPVFKMLLINNVYKIVLHIVKCFPNVTFTNISSKDKILAIGFTVECVATAM